MSSQQRRVALGIHLGLGQQGVAYVLGIALSTVKCHCREIAWRYGDGELQAALRSVLVVMSELLAEPPTTHSDNDQSSCWN
jgi:DNA-binding NarL/FixJ family response regulator